MRFFLSAMSFLAVFVILGRPGVCGQDEGSKPMVATVTAASAKVYCMQAETMDMTFPTRLAKDSLVIIRARGSSFAGTGTHFYKVALPGGVAGCIYAKLVKELESGLGEIAADSVLFRLGPSNQHSPIQKLVRGTKLHLLERQGDWWRVIAPEEVLVWMRAQDLKTIGPISEHEVVLKKARQERLIPWRKMVDKRAQTLVWNQKLAKARKGLNEIRAQLDQQLQGEPEKAELAGLRKNLGAFKKEWPKESLQKIGLGGALAVLEADVERLQLLKDALLAKKKEEQIQDATLKRPRPEKKVTPEFWKDSYVGHLVRLEDGPYMTDFAIVKGTKVVCYLKCSNHRYALADFNKCYVLVRGKAETPPSLKGHSLVHIKRLEILGVSK